MAWGWNGSGELGNGTATGSDVPVAVCANGPQVPCPGGPYLSGVTAISAGALHSLALALQGPWNVYVANAGSNNVSQYESMLGGLLSPLVPATETAHVNPTSVAVSPNLKSLYVTNNNPTFPLRKGSVSEYRFKPGGGLKPKVPAAIGAGVLPVAIATVQIASGEYTYVLDRGYEPDNEVISQYKMEANGRLAPLPKPTEQADFGGPAGIAVSPSRKYAYTSNASFQGQAVVKPFKIEANGELEWMGTPMVATGHAPGGIAVVKIASGEYLYVATGEKGIWQYKIEADGELKHLTPEFIAAGTNPAYIAVTPNGKYAYATNNGEGTVSQYGIGPGGELSPLAPGSVAAGKNPAGVVVTPDGKYVYVANHGENNVSQFKIGPAGELEPLSPKTETAGTQPFGIIALGGVPTEAEPISPPTVVTEPASSVTQRKATLNATVNPNFGEVSECKFEYGKPPAYDKSIPCSSLPPGEENSPIAVSASVTGLEVNTPYHFRISATNSGGTSKGSDETFKTLSCTVEGFCTTFTHLEPHEVPFEPTAVAVDSSGNVWVADSAHDHVLQFNSGREYVTQVGSEGSGPGQFKGIGGIATDTAGDLYVADQGNNRIEEFSPSGTLKRTFGSSAPGKGQLYAPCAIAIDESGNIWVLNAFFGSPEGGRVVEFSSSTAEPIAQFGSKGTGPGLLLLASGLAFSGGHLYVSELSPQRVQEFSVTPGASFGQVITQFDDGSPGRGAPEVPYAIASDPSTGNLYVTELGNRVQQFSPEGSFLSTFGSVGSGNGQFSFPEGIAVGASGTIYVADTHNERVQEWKAGEPPTFATAFTELESREVPLEPSAVAVDSSGNVWVADSAHDHVLQFNSGREYVTQVGSEGSGPGQFKGIGGIATDASGDLYVADQGNNRIEEFSPSGTLKRTFGSSAPGKGQLYAPCAIAIDESGNIWVLNAFFGSPEGGRVVEFSSSTAEPIAQFGSKGTGPGQLLLASGLAFSGGHLYVSELSPQRVQELSVTPGASFGQVITQFDDGSPGRGAPEVPYAIASDPSTGNLYVTELGNRVQEFSPEGSFLSTFGSVGSGNGQFSFPEGVAVDSSGVIYVADTHNDRVEEWLRGG